MAPFQDDHVASDDMDVVLDIIREEHEASQAASSSTLNQSYEIPDRFPSPDFEIVGSSSKPKANGRPTPAPANANKEYSRRDRPSAQILSRIDELDAEVLGCRADIDEIENRINQCLEEKKRLEKQLQETTGVTASNVVAQVAGSSRGKGKAIEQQGINYAAEKFDWTDGLKARMRNIFGIQEFRLCQAGVCNANMDGRDIVCIMPTGGGKSLTYQLPALLTAGCTLVISPLISLMTDQTLHLRDAGIEAAMITSATPKSDKAEITTRLQRLAGNNLGRAEKEIKLVYVTPERMSKDKSFHSLLQKLDNAGKFARIVIDEAHCVSQLGHDFRPDYKELHILRTIFPRVPIMALSATCGSKVLNDLISILRLREVVDGNNAPARGTVYFSSPLYRKNLHYNVVPKPDRAADQYEVMKEYILEHHLNQTGIVYCYSKKDTETVSDKLKELSGGRILTGVYHAGITDGEKQRLHIAWREGRVKVVCATIAFGMGIDKGDVRFVLHHSISKSLEGFYQESGRAGRDGKDSDCLLYYRPQDAATMAGTAVSNKDGGKKLHDMLDFAEDLRRCRKVQFAEYFSHSSQLAVSSWSTAETDALDPCGHCDNCTRPPDSIEKRDATLATWQLLKILQAVREQGGRLTLAKLAALARGGAKGEYDVSTKKGRKMETQTLRVDLENVAGGPVELSKLDIEHLIVRLTNKNYLGEEYQATAYSMNVYVCPGQLAARLTHQTRESILAGKANVKLEFDFIKPAAKKTRKTKPKKGDVDDNEAAGPSQSNVPKKRKTSGAGGKGKGKAKAVDVLSDEDDDLEGEYSFEVTKPAPGPSSKSIHHLDDMYDSDSDPGGRVVGGVNDDDDEEGESFDWSFSMREEPRPAKRQKKDAEKNVPKPRPRQNGGKALQDADDEVIELSSD